MEFGFRIITCNDGTEIIDRTKTTAYSELTPMQIVEYNELDVQLFIMDRLERKARVEKEKMEHRRKLAQNPLYRFACMCGFI